MILNADPAEAAPDSSPAAGSAGGLTRREREILLLLKEGLPNKVIAQRLSVSEVTVKSHLCSIFRKMGVQNRVQAIRRFAESEFG
jgi:DNA-binding NarL/FixJ family response regulator